MGTLLCVAAVGVPWEAHGQESCAAWPGEIDPLPRVDSSDRFEARWASLRARELGVLASALGADEPIAALQVWTHVLCLDPSAETPAGVPTELAPRVAYRDRPVRPAPAPPAPSPQRPASDFAPSDRALAAAETELAAARFKRALEAASEALELIGQQPDSPPQRERTARAEVMSATALVALGRSQEAEARFNQALAAKPDLELDATTTPPKILRLFQRIQAASLSSPREARP